MDLLPLILDGILVLIFVSCIIEGRRKGFVKTILSLGVTVISLLIAYEYSTPVAEWFNSTFIHERGVEWLTKLISDNISSGTDAVIKMIPESILDAVVPAEGIKAETLISGIGANADIPSVAERIYSAAENVLINVVVTAVVFLIIYAVVSGILSIGVSFINRFFKLPVLKGLNKLLGGALGALKGAVVVGILSVVLVMVSELFSGTPFRDAVNESSIAQFAWNIFVTF